MENEENTQREREGSSSTPTPNHTYNRPTSIWPKAQREFVAQLLGGIGAGLTAAAIVNPLDVVKIRLQNTSMPVTVSPGPTNNTAFRNIPTKKIPPPPIRTFPTLYSIYVTEGIWHGLFRGLHATLIAYTLDRALWFPLYTWCKARLQSYASTSPFSASWSPVVIHLGASVTASCICLCVTNPLWVVRTRIITQPRVVPGSTAAYHYTWLGHGIREIWGKEGAGAFFKGMAPSLLGLAHVAVQFPLYEYLKTVSVSFDVEKRVGPAHPREHHARDGTGVLSNGHLLVASSASKLVASVVTYPHEVVRTRLQSDSALQARYKGVVDCVRTMIQQEGIPSLYRGLGANLLRTVPATAISLWAYERIVHYIMRI